MCACSNSLLPAVFAPMADFTPCGWTHDTLLPFGTLPCMVSERLLMRLVYKEIMSFPGEWSTAPSLKEGAAHM